MYEFAVGGRYIYTTMRQPTFVFLIDASMESIQTGLFSSAINAIRSSLDSMPNPDNTNIAILSITNCVSFYSMSTDESTPRVYSCVEDNESFIPFPVSGIMMNLIKDRAKIDRLLDFLP